MADYVTEGDFCIFWRRKGQTVFIRKRENLLLGDIVISGDKVLQQAESYGHSPLRGSMLFDRTQSSASGRIRSYGRAGSKTYGKETGRCPGIHGNYKIGEERMKRN